MKQWSHLISTIFIIILFSQNNYAEEDCCFLFPITGEIGIAYDDFRGLSEGSWNGNTGGLIEVNFGTAIFDGIGLQLGGSYGVYDWAGRGPLGLSDSASIQEQGFISGGFFYKNPCHCPIQAGAIVDWMFNRNFGVFGLNPSFGQVRLQAGYLFPSGDEFGLWGSAYIRTDQKSAFLIPVFFRAVSQINLFWKHYFETSAEVMIWGGVPLKKSLLFSDSKAGKYIVGACFRAPLSSCLSVEGHGAYMGPHHNSASPRFQSYAANICIGINYFFGCKSNACPDLWQAAPYMPIANNSNFIVDTSLND
ncbi:DUF6666 family protein [Criblamydia sequanensis]|uniref:Conserved putative secreted protein n=1 Tax=Candidatus Criblamydia sequanensis CRIB-18 TaxID=1437425 RepID=A0A090D382_9BACT|nr:hypothetical protein [Criblamydia sequanensis]CDR35255.1 Conserved putative secreted protein [Criblamydia sequanensis CRIB-18]